MDSDVNQRVDAANEREIRSALSSVLSSDVFDNSPRLQEFLSYIVNESLAGRGDSIKGKTISADVYGTDLSSDASEKNLVRVEAGRLRRALSTYYTGTGQHDSIRIHVDTGGYNPRFERMPLTSTANANAVLLTRGFSIKWIAFGTVLLVFAVIGAVAYFLSRDQRPRSPSNAVLEVEKSMPSQQARNLAYDARGTLFPLFEVDRQKQALEMFMSSIELAPSVAEGYAGAAQVHGALALLTPEEARQEQFLNDGLRLSETALDLSPAHSWALGSNGWLLALKGRCVEAIPQAELAMSIAPKDGHLLDLVGIAAIACDMPDLAAKATAPDRERDTIGRSAAYNIWGLSQLMLGNDESVIRAFEEGRRSGAPVAAPAILFPAVAHYRLGNLDEANAMMAELKATWPNFPARFLTQRVFPLDVETRDYVFSVLDRYGY